MSEDVGSTFVLDTTDLDQARELVGRAILPFGLTPCQSGGYRARVRAGRVGRLGVAEVSYRGAVEIRSAVPDDTVVLEIPVAGVCRSGGRKVDVDAGRGDVIASPPNREIRTWMGEGSRLLVLRVPAVSFGRICDRQSLVSCVDANRLAALERVTRLVFERTPAATAVAADSMLGAELQRMMLALLGLAYTSESVGRASDPATVLPRAVRQAQALMIAAPSGDLCLPDVANRCGISVRTLQQNFRMFIGASPTEWWRAHRLDRVHALLCAGGRGVRVTDAATEYGFFHLGRFAQQYRDRFGESPSETLRWARITNAGRAQDRDSGSR